MIYNELGEDWTKFFYKLSKKKKFWHFFLLNQLVNLTFFFIFIISDDIKEERWRNRWVTGRSKIKVDTVADCGESKQVHSKERKW